MLLKKGVLPAHPWAQIFSTTDQAGSCCHTLFWGKNDGGQRAITIVSVHRVIASIFSLVWNLPSNTQYEDVLSAPRHGPRSFFPIQASLSPSLHLPNCLTPACTHIVAEKTEIARDILTQTQDDIVDRLTKLTDYFFCNPLLSCIPSTLVPI